MIDPVWTRISQQARLSLFWFKASTAMLCLFHFLFYKRPSRFHRHKHSSPSRQRHITDTRCNSLNLSLVAVSLTRTNKCRLNHDNVNLISFIWNMWFDIVNICIGYINIVYSESDDNVILQCIVDKAVYNIKVQFNAILSWGISVHEISSKDPSKIRGR